MNRNLVLALAGLALIPLVLLAAPLASPKAVTFTAGADSVVVPFVLRNNHIVVRGRIADSDSLWFLVDTGAGSHVVNRSRAETLGLQVMGGVDAIGSGGHEAGGMAHGVEFHLPGLDLEGPFTAVIGLDNVALQLGQPCDGVIGFPLFEHAVVTVDYARSVLVVREPAKFKSGAASLPLTFTSNHPYVSASVTLPGGKPVTGRFVIDTGSALGITFEPGFVKAQNALARVPKTILGRVGGVGGQALHPVGRIERLTLGPYALGGPIAVFSNPGPGQTSAPNSAGNLGGDILQRFRVTFDYPHKRLLLEPAPGFGRPFEADMTGIVIGVGADGTHPIQVLAVEPSSPAAEAGIAVGDVVESIDGQPFTAADVSEYRKRCRVEGAALRLGMRRGEARSEVTLTTRRQI